MSDPDRTPSSSKNYTQGHGSEMTSMQVKWCLWRCGSAMKRLRCSRPTKPHFGITWRPIWKRGTPVESHWLARYCTRPLSGKAKRKDQQTGQPKRNDTPDHTKQSGQEGIATGTHYTFMNSKEKTFQNLTDSNLYDLLRDPNYSVPSLQLKLKKYDPPLFPSSVPLP